MKSPDNPFVISRFIPREGIELRDAMKLSRGAYGRHQLIWDAFPNGDRPLFREIDQLQFLVVSDTPPNPDRRGWRIDTKKYTPRVKEGMRLEFSLRANATVCRDGKRHDIVKDVRIQKLKQGNEYLPSALDTANEIGPQWLARQGEQKGFALIHSVVTGMRQHKTKNKIKFTTLDFNGVLSVTDPQEFVTTLYTGIGRAKAFGAGLLLVKPLS